MSVCHLCWKTKEVSPVFVAYPKAVEFCKGCSFDIHRIINALAYVLDTTGFAIVLAKRNLTLLVLGEHGQTYINLWTGELVEGVNKAGETGSPVEAESKGEIEGGSREGGLREGQGPENLPEPPPGAPGTEVHEGKRRRIPKP